jgi:hypothetical protein
VQATIIPEKPSKANKNHPKPSKSIKSHQKPPQTSVESALNSL